MEYNVIFRNFEVHVDFHTALMSMCRHCVPDAARLENCHTHRKLACFENIRMDELIDRTLVGCLHSTYRALVCLLDRNKCCLVSAMCRSADHVELGRLLRINTLECNFLCSLSDVEAVLVVHVESIVVSCDAACSADVEDADLAALKDIICAEVMPYVDALFEGNFLVNRHASECDHTVNMGVYAYDFVRAVEIRDEEFIAHLLCGVSLEISLIYRVSDVHDMSFLLCRYEFPS